MLWLSCVAALAVSFGGKTFTLDKAPADFPAKYKDLIVQYEEYAIANGIQVVGDPSCPAVIFTAGTLAEAQTVLKQAQKLFSAYDKVFKSTTERKPFPIFLLKKTKQYGPLLDMLVKKNAYLSAWAESARKLSGFELYKPPIVTILQDGVKQEEYSLTNQVIHQTTHVFLNVDFGTIPFWMSEGLAWHFEEEITKELYAFCYRDEFVFAAEHRSWVDHVQKMIRKGEAPKLEESCRSAREKFEKNKALVGFAFCRFFVAEKSDQLPFVLQALGAEQKKRFAKEPTRELEPAQQIEILKSKFGQDLDAQLQSYWSKR